VEGFPGAGARKPWNRRRQRDTAGCE
jgi:hypothetical protein